MNTTNTTRDEFAYKYSKGGYPYKRKVWPGVGKVAIEAHRVPDFEVEIRIGDDTLCVTTEDMVDEFMYKLEALFEEYQI